MFEKEAEEYANKNETRGGSSSFGDITNYHDLRQGFIAGAEFGYNKANEWHYVKDGDLPKEDTKVLALMAGGEVYIAHFYKRNVWDKIGTVIAWKEIVLPKEIKENDL